eukprot:GHVT01065330.1.p1 GENE.GHVT01065330.1~~GHVT01065330.1.p1  ORF type:complete len:152 (-),score=21.15 GHVT01065330.1:581-1036(-)
MVRTRANNYSFVAPSSDPVASLVSENAHTTMADSPAPVDAAARQAIEQQQAAIASLTALLRGPLPAAADSLVPPSPADLHAMLLKNMTTQATYQRGLFLDDATSPSLQGGYRVRHVGRQGRPRPQARHDGPHVLQIRLPDEQSAVLRVVPR